MITVTLNRKAETLSLCVTGHAGFASMGQDIVCAAASMLAYALSSRLDDMGRLTRREMEPGRVRIGWEDTREARENASGGAVPK